MCVAAWRGPYACVKGCGDRDNYCEEVSRQRGCFYDYPTASFSDRCTGTRVKAFFPLSPLSFVSSTSITPDAAAGGSIPISGCRFDNVTDMAECLGGATLPVDPATNRTAAVPESCTLPGLSAANCNCSALPADSQAVCTLYGLAWTPAGCQLAVLGDSSTVSQDCTALGGVYLSGPVGLVPPLLRPSCVREA